jgi:hypothetical protein
MTTPLSNKQMKARDFENKITLKTLVFVCYATFMKFYPFMWSLVQKRPHKKAEKLQKAIAQHFGCAIPSISAFRALYVGKLNTPSFVGRFLRENQILYDTERDIFLVETSETVKRGKVFETEDGPVEAEFDHHVVYDYNDNRIEVPSDEVEYEVEAIRSRGWDDVYECCSYRIKYLGFRQEEDTLSWYTPDDMKEEFNRKNPKTGRELSSNHNKIRGRYYYHSTKDLRMERPRRSRRSPR